MAGAAAQCQPCSCPAAVGLPHAGAVGRWGQHSYWQAAVLLSPRLASGLASACLHPSPQLKKITSLHPCLADLGIENHDGCKAQELCLSDTALKQSLAALAYLLYAIGPAPAFDYVSEKQQPREAVLLF